MPQCLISLEGAHNSGLKFPSTSLNIWLMLNNYSRIKTVLHENSAKSVCLSKYFIGQLLAVNYHSLLTEILGHL